VGDVVLLQQRQELHEGQITMPNRVHGLWHI
jgi:hypothetical protein